MLFRVPEHGRGIPKNTPTGLALTRPANQEQYILMLRKLET